MRGWSLAKLVTPLSKATISPPKQKTKTSASRARLPTLGIFHSAFSDSGKTEARPCLRARQRSPSSLGSNNHPLREKLSSVKVASIGDTHVRLGHLRSRARASAGN